MKIITVVFIICWWFSVQTAGFTNNLEIEGIYYPVRIFQNAPARTPVLHVRGHNRHSGESSHNYGISSGDQRHFSVNRTSGQISVRVDIDKPLGYTFVFRVYASLNNQVRDRQVEVIVSYYNEYPPRFDRSNYTLLVSRDTAVNHSIVRLNATDADAVFYNARVTYAILEEKDAAYFAMGAGSGVLQLASELPRNRDNLRITAVARDWGSPRRHDMATLTISITNLSAPDAFCSIVRQGSLKVCWKNSNRQRVEGYNVEIQNERTRSVRIHGMVSGFCLTIHTQHDDSYRYRIQAVNQKHQSPFSDWHLVDTKTLGQSENCLDFNPCSTENPCRQGTCTPGHGTIYECTCLYGWRGRNCSEEDACAFSPCSNNSTCTPLALGKVSCNCTANYYGIWCQHFNSCALDQCKNGATCQMSVNGKMECICRNFYSGTFCENPDPCQPPPCHNGVCRPVSNSSYSCSCHPGYYGLLCDRANPCVLHSPCVNGICSLKANSTYSCHCRKGFKGINCSEIDPCDYIHCLNGGTCVGGRGQHQYCRCVLGYYGGECQRYNPCLALPCQNGGRCRNLSSTQYECECREPFYGRDCEQRSPCHRSLCLHEGVCQNISQVEYRCRCSAGHYGKNCQHTNACAFAVCENNGTCENVTDDGRYACRCPTGYRGDSCQHVDPCLADVCAYQSTCVLLPDGRYTCRCSAGFSGKHCDHFDYCTNSTCLNGGTCSNSTQTNRPCDCKPLYFGTKCQLFDFCASSPCRHGGSCNLTFGSIPAAASIINGFHCSCPQGYLGASCEVDVTCHPQVCKNGGTCVDSTQGYNCSCLPGYTGKQCLYKVTPCLPDPCRNGGTCQVEKNLLHTCRCPLGYLGGNCESEAECPPKASIDQTGHYEWTETRFGRTLHLPCQFGSHHSGRKGQAHRVCDLDPTGSAVWRAANTSECLGKNFFKAALKLNDLRRRTADPSEMSADDVVNITTQLEEVFPYSLQDQQMAEDLTIVISNILNANATVLKQGHAKGKTSNRLSLMLEDYTENANLSGGTVLLTSENVHLMASEPFWNQSITDVVEYETRFLVDNQTSKGGLLAVLPAEVLISHQARLQFVAYRNAKLFASSSTPPGNQRVIFVAIKGRDIENLSTPARFTIPSIQSGSNHTCVYWKTKDEAWSTDGVITISKAAEEIECEAFHLTSFSIILDPSPNFKLAKLHEDILTYISYIGCGISVFGLVATIITYSMFRCLNQDKSGRILLNLCTSMLMLNVVFLLGSQSSSTYGTEICIAVAVLMHYFLLTSLLWMCIEAVNMYHVLVTVFAKYSTHFMLRRFVFAWGVPAAIVAVTLAVDIHNYETKTQSCFLSHGNRVAFYITLLMPSCIVLVVNLVVFIMVSKVIVKPKFKDKNQSSHHVTLAQVRGTFTVMVLLGITWVFGPLAINELKLTFNYIFSVLNSLQGFLVFVFRCFMNPEVKMAWVQLLKTGTFKKQKGPPKAGLDSSSRSDSKAHGQYGGTMTSKCTLYRLSASMNRISRKAEVPKSYNGVENRSYTHDSTVANTAVSGLPQP